ncbi:hypothetical protein EDC04DRAFT_1210164 [Pisolithus marmoratus]|nr:hypothetical protein EDC04DRAFT_1210164 [Pisolithus marmoratus]
MSGPPTSALRMICTRKLAIIRTWDSINTAHPARRGSIAFTIVAAELGPICRSCCSSLYLQVSSSSLLTMNVGLPNLACLGLSRSPKAIPEDISFDLTVAAPPRGYCMATTASPRVPISGIPLEIVLHILELAHLNDNHEPDTQLLASFSLTCRSWSFHAQKLLFRRVRLHSEATYESFVFAVDRSTTRGIALGNAVHQLHVVLDDNQHTPLERVSFARAITLCPNLHEINLSVYGFSELARSGHVAERVQRPAPPFAEHVLDLIRTGPEISHLHFSNWSDNDDMIVQLLTVWPSLKTLSITGKTPHLSPALKRRPCYPGTLEKLRMNCQVEPSLDFLEWLLHTSADSKSLRGIELNREPSFHLLDFLVEHHGEQLHTLSLPSCTTHKHAHAVIRCRALREFRTERAWTLPTIFRHLPEHVRHLAFGMDPSTPLQHIVELVKTKDELESVAVNVWRGDCERQLGALKMACAFRGVELRITRDICLHRALVRR